MEDKFILTKKLDHLAFIMDGNGRWAKKRLLPRSLGHKAGVKKIKEIVDLCFFAYGIKVVSLFCFSTENWNRPQAEISFLFNLLKTFFKDNIDDFIKKETRITISGDLDDPRIPSDVKETMDEAINKTKQFNKHVFNVLFNYGGRREIVYACKQIAKKVQNNEIKIDEITEQTINDNLYNLLPPVDLLIRTSGEQRLSNCLLWEAAYAEFVFPKQYWPSFSKIDLENCLQDYQNRNRRFGGLKNE